MGEGFAHFRHAALMRWLIESRDYVAISRLSRVHIEGSFVDNFNNSPVERLLRASKRSEVLRRACASGKHYFPWRPGEPACIICGTRLAHNTRLEQP